MKEKYFPKTIDFSPAIESEWDKIEPLSDIRNLQILDLVSVFT